MTELASAPPATGESRSAPGPATGAAAPAGLPPALATDTLSALLALGSEAVLLVADGQLLLHNAAAAPLLDCHAPPALPPDLLHQLPAAPGPQGTSTTARLHRADGRCLQATIRSASLPGGAVLHVINDLSSLLEAKDALEASNRELKAMARRLFSAQEDERRAISRDLHDDIGQSITAMRMSAHAAMMEPDPERRREDLAHLLAMADQTTSRLRDLSMLLRPPQLDALGLEAALRWQADLILRNTGLALEADIRPLGSRLPAETEQACFRIAQEALTNIVRHARAGTVQLSLQPQGCGRVELVVADDGRGFEASRPGGLGLVVMRERAEGAGGTLRLFSAPGQGTRIHCTLPVQPPR